MLSARSKQVGDRKRQETCRDISAEDARKPRTVMLVLMVSVVSSGSFRSIAAANPQMPDASAPESATATEQRVSSADVGMEGSVRDIVLPGTELQVAETDPRTAPIQIRIDGVYPHGDHFRYDLTWFGYEPGTYDLTDFLVRRDGSSVTELPAIPVEVTSVLEAGKVSVTPVSQAEPVHIGGYRNIVTAILIVWCAGLFFLLRKSGNAEAPIAADAESPSESAADQVSGLLSEALRNGSLSAEQRASLQMRVLAFWCERKKLQEESPPAALSLLQRDPEAGPLLTCIERWFYSREAPDHDEIARVVRPMQDMLEQGQETDDGRADGDSALKTTAASTVDSAAPSGGITESE